MAAVKEVPLLLLLLVLVLVLLVLVLDLPALWWAHVLL